MNKNINFEKIKTIGLIDNELNTRANHSFPNLAIMKLSTYFKNKGCNVRLISFEEINPNNLFTTEFDVIFVSKVFSDTETPKFIDNMANVVKGGSGFYYDKAIPLNYDIEHSFPDYDLYANLPSCKHDYYHKYSIGFITRGCIRQCDFCINRNSKKVEAHSKLSEFVDKKRPYIMLLDDNITAYKGFYETFEDLNKLNIPFVFKQGMDFRLLNKKKMDILWNSNYYSTSKSKGKGGRVFHFAFDDVNDIKIIEKNLQKYYLTKPFGFVIQFYVLTGFDRNGLYDEAFFKDDVSSLLKRIKLLLKYGAQPYIMIHEDVKLSPHKDLIYDLKNIYNHIMNYAQGIEYALDRFKKIKLKNYITNNHSWFLETKLETKLYKHLTDEDKKKKREEKKLLIRYDLQPLAATVNQK